MITALRPPPTAEPLATADERQDVASGILALIEEPLTIESIAVAADVELVGVPHAGVPFFLYDRFACYVVVDEPRVNMVRAARGLAMMIGDRMGCRLTSDTDALAMLFIDALDARSKGPMVDPLYPDALPFGVKRESAERTEELPAPARWPSPILEEDGSSPGGEKLFTMLVEVVERYLTAAEGACARGDAQTHALAVSLAILVGAARTTKGADEMREMILRAHLVAAHRPKPKPTGDRSGTSRPGNVVPFDRARRRREEKARGPYEPKRD